MMCVGEKRIMSEEWVELKLDSRRKIVMPRRELTNLAQRISRVFAPARPVKPPIDVNPRTGRNVKIEPLFEATVLRPKKNRATDSQTSEQGGA
jgi:hypothetical protein